ncbi:MAG: DUF4926 domain-containing protein [Cyanothece sp. SIO2G6]|nr:DUF4926 domain-containing protein [Cyanothece sp. SIO2G6]
MSTQHSLFSQVVLAEDIPEHHLKRGDRATVVEYYAMPDDEEDGYSLEGFDVPNITVEVAASQIMSPQQWQQQQAILQKLGQLSAPKLLQLEEFLDFLIQKESSGKKSA